MWSDTLLAAERAHLVRLLVWAAVSVAAGTLLLVFVALRRERSTLLAWFGGTTAAWGLVEAAIALVALRGLAMRDFAGAARLANRLWLEAGLDTGYVVVGMTLLATGWLFGRRLAVAGVGAAVVLQGLALLVLHLRFIAIARFLI